MYTEYFGLQEKPFTVSPNPRYLYMSEHHQEAMAHLLYGIRDDGCLVMLTGDAGTGKTMVCRSFLEQLPLNTAAVYIVNPRLSAHELLATICEEMGISIKKSNSSIKVYIDAINTYLLHSYAMGKIVLLIIDEAQDLDMDVLEQLRLMTNLETNTNKLLKIIIVGQSELLTKLQNPIVNQIRQRITSRFHIHPLNERDTCGLIRYRLKVAGGGRMQFFSKKALKRAYQFSKGVPSRINMLCDQALLNAYIEESGVYISEKAMLKAGREMLDGDTPSTMGTSSKNLLIAILAAFVFVSLGTGYLLFFKAYLLSGGEENKIVSETGTPASLEQGIHIQQE